MKTRAIAIAALLLLAPSQLPAWAASITTEQARGIFFTLTNRLSACGMTVTDPQKDIAIFKSTNTRLEVSFNSRTIAVDLVRDAHKPRFYVLNYESQYWVRRNEKPSATDNYQFKLNREQAEAKAKVFAGHLGPQVDDSYRFHPCEWPMSRSHYPDAGARSWAFSWHRHIGGYPVMTETIEAVVDDATGGFAKYHSHVRDEAYVLVQHPVPTPEAARKGIEQVIYKGYDLDPGKPEKGYLHHIGGPFLVVASPRVLTAEQIAKLGKTPKGEQRVRLAWAYHFWITYSGKPTEERLKRLQSGEAARGLFDAETFKIIPL